MIKISGEIIHSRSFKSATGYENKKAIVVGLGNSGCDAAVKLRFHFLLNNVFSEILFILRLNTLEKKLRQSNNCFVGNLF
jgi:hypothetical protein